MLQYLISLLGALLEASMENFKRCCEGKDINEWAQPPEPLTLTIGDRFSVVVSHFQSPTDFIVQKVENAGKENVIFVIHI